MKIKDACKQEYAKRISSLHFNIENAIIEYFMLCEIDALRKSFILDSLTIFAMQSQLLCLEIIIQSIKKDFCLLVWCLCCDTDTKANTIPKLKNAVIREYFDTPNLIKVATPNSKGGIMSALDYARKKYIAHHDFEATFGRISLDDLFVKFKEYVKVYNSVIFGEFKLTHVISETKLSALRNKAHSGILHLLNGDMLKFFKAIGEEK